MTTLEQKLELNHAYHLWSMTLAILNLYPKSDPMHERCLAHAIAKEKALIILEQKYNN